MGGYLAAGWGLLQFVSWATDRYAFTSSIVDTLTGAWLIFIPVVAYFAWKHPDEAVESYGAVFAEPGSVAVLPFVNRSPSSEDAFLSDGISEEISNSLARVEGVRVAGRSSAFALKDRNLGARAIGQTLGVRHVLEGSVQRSGNQLRVSTQLVDAEDGFQLWSDKWDAEMADVFAIEDEIANKVTRALRGVLRTESCITPQVPRANLKAYEQFLRGRQFYRQTRKKSLGYARDMFRRAIDLDAAYAPAHAALADSITLELMYYHNTDVDLAEADQASRRALELDPALAEAHAARGSVLVQLRRFEEAEAEFKAATNLNPRLMEAWYFYARMCFQQGRFADAARLFSQACEVCEDYQAAFFMAQTLEALDQDEKARLQYQVALDIVERYMELNPDDARAATMRSTALCRLDRLDEGLHWAARAVQIDPEDAGVRYNVACTFSLAGRIDEAIGYLEDAVRVGFGNREWLERDPDLAPLREDARFKSLISGM